MPSIPTIATFVPGEAMPLTVMPVRTIERQASNAFLCDVYVDPIGKDIAKLFATTTGHGGSESAEEERMLTSMIWQFQDECFVLARKTILRFQNGVDPLKLADELEENINRGEIFRKHEWLGRLNDLYATGTTRILNVHKYYMRALIKLQRLRSYLRHPDKWDSEDIHRLLHYTINIGTFLKETRLNHEDSAKIRGVSISHLATRSHIDNSPFINWRKLETLTNTVVSIFVAACENDKGAVDLTWDDKTDTLRIKATNIDTAKLSELEDATKKLEEERRYEAMAYELATGFNEATFTIHIPRGLKHPATGEIIPYEKIDEAYVVQLVREERDIMLEKLHKVWSRVTDGEDATIVASDITKEENKINERVHNTQRFYSWYAWLIGSEAFDCGIRHRINDTTRYYRDLSSPKFLLHSTQRRLREGWDTSYLRSFRGILGDAVAFSYELMESRGIKWTEDIGGRLPLVDNHRVNNKLAEEIICELVKNAVKNADSHVRAETDAEQNIFRVINDGPGIPTDRSPFIGGWRLRPEMAGSQGGYGLAYYKKLAETEGWELTYTSEPGRTVFELKLREKPHTNEVAPTAIEHARLYEQQVTVYIDSLISILRTPEKHKGSLNRYAGGHGNQLIEELAELEKDPALANAPLIKMALEYRYRRTIELFHRLSLMKLDDELVRDIAVAILSRSTSDLPIVRRHQRRRKHVQATLLAGEVKTIKDITPEKAVQSIRTIIDAFQNIVAVIVAKASAEGTRGAVKFVRDNLGRLQEMLAQFDIISASLRAKEMMSEELLFTTSMVRHEIIGRDLQTIYSLLDFDDDIGPEEEAMLKSSIECLSPYSQYLTFLTGHIFQRYSVQVAKGEVELVNDIPLTTVLAERIDLQKAVTIITNLAENGVKYRDKTKAKSIVRIGFDEAKNEIIYEDNGIGMSAKFLQKILASAGPVREKRDRAVKGTGTGWTLIKRMIAELGWKITEIQTAPNEGVRMRIALS